MMGKGPFIPSESHLLVQLISSLDGHHVRPCVRMLKVRWIQGVIVIVRKGVPSLIGCIKRIRGLA